MASPATYTFLPWLRQGLSNSISEAETAANPSLRASITVQLKVSAQPVAAPVPDATVDKIVRLFGPGDLNGMDRGAIFKTEPYDWNTNFEANNLAHIEFYDEDFPWRYTPAHADTTTHRHRPWLALVVLEEGEFVEGDIKAKPLPFVDIGDLTKLPAKEELWAWAHVHVNRNLGAGDTTIVSDDGTAVAAKLGATLAENRDLAYSRIISPRHLEPNKGYHAFLMPSFETGRVAGLGLDVTKVDDAMRGAWEAHAQRANLQPNRLPYYHRWYFRTGNAGDFEYLVRLLKPQPMDARVGTRDIDVQQPGSDLPGIAGPDGDGVLRLGGALRVPRKALSAEQQADADRFDNWAQPAHPFPRDLAAFINLADDYSRQPALAAHEQPQIPAAMGTLPDGSSDPDPMITPPLYGRWHALVQRLLTRPDGSPAPHAGNWIHQLNLDPRHRTAAGLGTRVVRDKQEDYVNAAWQQVGEVLEANRKMRLAQVGQAVSQSWYTRTFVTMQAASPEAQMTVSAPIARRVVSGGLTVRKQIVQSAVPVSMVSGAMRRVLRPNGRMVRKLTAPAVPMAGAPASAASAPAAAAARLKTGLLTRLNEGTLATAQPPAVPPGAPSVAGLSRSLLPSAPAWLLDLLRRRPNLPLILLIVGLVLALLLFMLAGPALGLLVGGLVAAVQVWLRNLARKLTEAESLLPQNQTPAAVAALPSDSAFSIQPFGTAFAGPPTGTGDSPDAVRFKQALRDAFALSTEARAANQPAARTPLDVPATSGQMLAAIDPGRSVPKRFYRAVQIPDRIKDDLDDGFVEAWAYPRIDEPMYRPLVALGSELFLPNVGLIPQNSITLLETNQTFIESYMVGLNHEFARELLWREYPTDQRGSTFRQFWDVSGYKRDPGLTDDQMREKLYDVSKLHEWPATSQLGGHDNRQAPGSIARDEVVLAIRGELLKRYSNAVIYAHKADWQLTDGAIDKKKIRQLIALSSAEETDPPRDKVKTPLYEAKVDPDITFFGFDLTVTEARGNPDAGDAGWFFVIKERDGEPRFGLDVERDGAPINTWSDLAWDDVTTEQALLRIRAGMNSYLLNVPPPASEGAEEGNQYLEDKQVAWNENTNAADVAYVLYQLPVLVAVHAAEMLPGS